MYSTLTSSFIAINNKQWYGFCKGGVLSLTVIKGVHTDNKEKVFND